MPLSKSSSKTAQKQNFKRELAAGKPPKQAYAISKNVQRTAKARGK